MPPKRKRLLQPNPASVSGLEDIGPVSVSDGESETEDHDAPNAVLVDAPNAVQVDTPNAVQIAQEQEAEPLLGLDFSLIQFTGAIRQLVNERALDGPHFCHLRDLPENAIWSQSNTLSVSTPSLRAIVLVAFGSLAGFELAVVRGQAATLTVAVELFGHREVTKLQQILDWAGTGQVATRELIAVRVSAGSRSRLLNVYDRSGRAHPKHRVVPLSLNELLGGDVVRVVMRCVQIKHGDGFRVEFKLKSLSLFVPVPRGVDIM